MDLLVAANSFGSIFSVLCRYKNSICYLYYNGLCVTMKLVYEFMSVVDTILLINWETGLKI